MPQVNPPAIDFLSGNADNSSLLPTAIDFLPKQTPAPRAWEWQIYGSVLPRLNGRDVYKRAGLPAAEDARKTIKYLAARAELFSDQYGRRKRPCHNTHLFAYKLGDCPLEFLWDLRALSYVHPNQGERDLQGARRSIIDFYGQLQTHGFPVPKLIEHHTWHGSIEISVMTVLPRKRTYNSDPILRHEENLYSRAIGVTEDPNKIPHSRRATRHMRTARRNPSMSTIDELSEPASSPVAVAATPLRQSLSPFKTLLPGQSALSTRTTLSPWRFTFLTPSKVIEDGDMTTPSKVCSVGARSPKTPKPLSAIRAAAFARTPDIFSSPAIAALSPRLQQLSSPVAFGHSAVDEPTTPVPRGTPTSDRRRSSSPTKKTRRRSSLATTRLLAISEHYSSPATSRRGSLAPSESVAEVSQVDITMHDASTLHNTSTIHCEEEMFPAERDEPQAEMTTSEEQTTIDNANPATPESNNVTPTPAEADTVELTSSDPQDITAIVINTDIATPADVEAGSIKRLKNCDNAVDVDLRENPDIFGSFRDAPMKSLSNKEIFPASPLTREGSSTGLSSPISDMDNDPIDDEEMTAVINHDQINDTISLKLGYQKSPTSDKPTADQQNHNPPSPKLSDDQDEDRQNLQSFLNRVNAGKSAKAKRRPTSTAGSPMSHNSDSDCDLGKRQPLGSKDPNMSPSPSKKRKSDAAAGSLLQAPALDDHSPPRPKRRRKNTEAETDGVLNPAFSAPVTVLTPVAAARELRRSTRTRTLVPTAPSANTAAKSRVPVPASSAAERSHERKVKAVTDANTRLNKAGARVPAEVLADPKRRRRDGDDQSAARGTKRVRTGGPADSNKRVRWDTVLTRSQEAPPSANEAEEEDDDEDELALDAPAAAVEPMPKKRRSQLPAASTPMKKTTAGAEKPAVAGGRVKNAVVATAALAVPKRTSAQLAKASAAKAATETSLLAAAVQGKTTAKRAGRA